MVKKAIGVFSFTKKINPLFFSVTILVMTAILIVVFFLTGGRGEPAGAGLEYGDRNMESQARELLGRVEKHIRLPRGEEPIVATVTDARRLIEEQPFYKDVKNGHKVLIYSSKAIIYDPVNDVLINVGPIMVNDAQDILSGQVR